MDEGLEPFEFSEPMPCYESNPTLAAAEDDGGCAHCRKYLTIECPYIDHFLSEDDG